MDQERVEVLDVFLLLFELLRDLLLLDFLRGGEPRVLLLLPVDFCLLRDSLLQSRVVLLEISDVPRDVVSVFVQ